MDPVKLGYCRCCELVGGGKVCCVICDSCGLDTNADLENDAGSFCTTFSGFTVGR